MAAERRKQKKEEEEEEEKLLMIKNMIKIRGENESRKNKIESKTCCEMVLA